MDKNKVAHDLTILHLEKTFHFSDELEGDENTLASEYERTFQNIKLMISDHIFDE